MIHLQEMEKRESITGVSNWMNVTFIDSDNPLNSDHFAFKFKTKKPKDIINCSFLVLNGKTELIEFIDGEKKSLLLNFRIDGLK